MEPILNTLYVLTEGAYVHVDHETLVVEHEGEKLIQAPVHHLGAVCLFGNIMISPQAVWRCAEDGRMLCLFDRNGRFKARLSGPQSGNVLLRLAQHKAHADPDASLKVARAIAAGKLQNMRYVLLRGARDSARPIAQGDLRAAAEVVAKRLAAMETAANTGEVRGNEGEAAVAYFGVLDHLIMHERETFRFTGRNRRPPRDPFNALISFLYALLMNDCVAACEGVGLDPQVGFMHTPRPGRASLALDLMEELRSPLCDRLALTMVNLRQLSARHFVERTGGAVLLNDEGRRAVLAAWQRRKAEEVRHSALDRNIPFGLVPHVQARLLARYLRGDIAEYVPYLQR